MLEIESRKKWWEVANRYLKWNTSEIISYEKQSNHIEVKGVAAVQKGNWKQLEWINLSSNEVNLMGLRCISTSQFHCIDNLYLHNREESDLKELVEMNKSAL